MFGGENLYHQKQAREGPVHSQAHVHQINQYINLLNLVILVSRACEPTSLRVYLACVELEQVPKNWTRTSCMSSGLAEASNDVICHVNFLI